MAKRMQRVLVSEVGKRSLTLGYQGENDHTQVRIGCTLVYTDYPAAEVQLVVRPPVGDTYLAVVEKDGTDVVWDITASDAAHSGSGQYQLTFTVNGTEVFKSAIGSYKISSSLDEASGSAPTPAETWAEAMAGEFEEQIAEAAGDAVEGKADKTDTVLLTTLSCGRKANTTVGTGSFAFGVDVEASGNYSQAEGANTTASGLYSHAEGGGTTASGVSSHAEGEATITSGRCSHAEGSRTSAGGLNSHAEGYCTEAMGDDQHVSGKYNVPDITSAEIVGNGTAVGARSNARTLDWNGNEKLAGSLTLGMGTADETAITAAQLKALLALLQ